MRCYWETLNKHLDKTCLNERQKSYSVLPISHPTSVAPAASSTNAVGITGMILWDTLFQLGIWISSFVPERLKCNFHFTFFAHALLDNVMFSMIYGKAQKVPLPMQARFSSTNSCQRKMTLSKNPFAFCYSSESYLRSFFYLVFHSSLWCYDLMGYFVIMDYCWHSFATVDECESSPCKNGASCKITQDGYSCQPCPAGWDGKNCDEGLMRLWINYLFGLGKSLTASSLVPFQRKVSSIAFF